MPTKKPKLVVLSGAGISAESGIPTFRGSDGLWEGHRIEEVASPQGWGANPELVLDFYNKRRAVLGTVEPNDAHKVLAELEEHFEVVIITQNVDNLHERGGSSNIMHLHGELTKVRSTKNPGYVIDIGLKEIKLGDSCPKGGQLRPHIVWFGEDVPLIEKASQEAASADIFLVVGTSMNVYPAAGLINFVGLDVPKFVVDLSIPTLERIPRLVTIEEKASTGMKKLRTMLLRDYI